MSSRLVLAAVLMACFSAPLAAQRRAQPGQQQVPLQPVEVRGTIEGLARGRMIVRDVNNQPWQVAIPVNAKVQVTGGADLDCLRNGMFIEFIAELDDRGVLKDKVGALTIVTLSPERQMGLFPPVAITELGDFDWGANNDQDHQAAKPTKRSGGKAVVRAGKYRIVGRLTVARGGKLSVQVGRGSIPLELAEPTAVTIDIRDYSVASQGDHAIVKGVMMPGRPGMAQAAEVTIELAKPLSGAKKKGPAAKTKRPAKRPEKKEGLPEMPAE